MYRKRQEHAISAKRDLLESSGRRSADFGDEQSSSEGPQCRPVPNPLPATMALLATLAIAAILSVFSLWILAGFVKIPADILMWGETGFVETIIKLRSGVPIYGSPADNNSILYTPLSPILTHAISRLTPLAPSVPLFRWIQLGYVVLAALLGVLCWRMLRDLAYPDHQLRRRSLWSALVFLSLFLAGISENVNRFTYCLHVDALALPVSMFCFWTVLRYIRRPGWSSLALMAICPAIGFMTKQLLLSWAAAMTVAVLLRGLLSSSSGFRLRDRATWVAALKPVTLLLALSGLCFGLTLVICDVLWGHNFFFWVFNIMGPRKHLSLSPVTFQISLPRAIEHALRAWSELGIGILGGVLVLRARNAAKLGPAFAAWLTIVASEIYSSGAGWSVLYHFGPGVVIGCIWLLAAASRWWPSGEINSSDEFPMLAWLAKPVLGLLGAICFFASLHAWPSGDVNSGRWWGMRKPSPDMNRYISDIESEFKGLTPAEVLLDAGNWIALQQNFVAKDQAPALADQPPSNIYSNIEILASRIRAKTYKKILVHDFDSPYFLYDWRDWPRSSGIRAALLHSYVRKRIIPGAGGETNLPPAVTIATPISVFELRQQ